MKPMLVILLAGAAVGQRPVEQETFLTGAWASLGEPAQRELYAKCGFTLVGYGNDLLEWGAAHDLRYIAGVSRSGLPEGVNRPFEAHDGTRSMSVGLFTAINFNAPSVAAWWAERVPEVVRAMPQADRVAFWKVHNEFGYHAGKYWDYSPGTVARFQQWLSGRYASIAELNRRWGTSYASFDAVQPVRTLPTTEVANWLEWRRFTCWSFADYFKTTGDLIRGVAPAAKVSDNLYSVSPLQGWDDFELARQTDYVAYDIYAIGRWDQLISIMDHARCAAAAWDKPFLMMEYHAGPNNWCPVVRAEDLWIEAHLALARECRALQWYRWNPGGGGREQGIHGIVDTQGRPTERNTAVRDVSEKLQRLAPLLHRSTLEAPVALLVSADTAYLATASGGSGNAGRPTRDTLGRLLDDARIAHEAIDPVWLQSHSLDRYQVVLVAELPCLGDAELDKLRAFAANGGTVIVFPGSLTRDDLGRPREATVAGSGRWVTVAEAAPTDTGQGETRGQRGAALATLLADRAGVRPGLVVHSTAAPWELDAAVLRAGDARLVILTHLSHEPLTDVRVELPADDATGAAAWALLPRTAAVEPLPLTKQAGTASFTLPRLDPGAIVVLGAWQPLVGVAAPPRLTPGGSYEVGVSVDNVDGVDVGHNAARLLVPAGWSAEPLDGGAQSLQPGARSVRRFRVMVPADAAVDRFGLDHPLRGEVTFTAGRTGILTATATPLVVPALDLELVYAGATVNPWQELSPPILRWGWDSEVHIPPPPPVAIRAETPVVLRLTTDARLDGQHVRLSLDEGSVTPSEVTLQPGTVDVPLKLRLERPGEHRLTAQAGPSSEAASFVAGVNTETLETALAASKPALPNGYQVLGRLAVGARDAPARGTPVTFAAKLAPDQADRAVVLDQGGHGVPATVGPESVTVAADVAQDGTAVYTVAVAPATADHPRAVDLESGQDDALLLHGQGYTVAFDTTLGLVRWLQVGDGPRLAPHRTGVVATLAGGGTWAPDGAHRASSVATSASPVSAKVELQHALGPHDELDVTETWALEAQRVFLELRLRNAGKGPLELSRLEWELGLDPETVPRWRRWTPGGPEGSGELPSGFGPVRNATGVDWSNAAGRGLALTLGRCALASQWQAGWLGVSHNPARTAVGLMAGVRLDPGDWVLAEVALWPHTQALPEGAAAEPTLVTMVR